MSNSNKSNLTIIDDCTKRMTGIKKYVDPNADIPVAGKVAKPAEFLAVFQADVDQRNQVATLQAQVKSAISVRKTKDAERHVYDVALHAYVSQRFGADSTEAHDFGYPPPKPKTQSAATKAAAVKKSQATRAARHTMGPKEKAKLKGTTVVEVTPEQAAALAAGEATASAVVVSHTPEQGEPPPTHTVEAAPAGSASNAAGPPAASNGVTHS
jgi:hypothetical protein